MEALLVLEKEAGIRPAGPKVQCLYCGQKVGTPHAKGCETIVRETTYGVYLDGERIGTWKDDDTADWDTQQCEFFRNQSSWCIDNFLRYGVLDIPKAALERVQAARRAGDGDDLAPTCLCFTKAKVLFKVESRAEEPRRGRG